MERYSPTEHPYAIKKIDLNHTHTNTQTISHTPSPSHILFIYTTYLHDMSIYPRYNFKTFYCFFYKIVNYSIFML